MRLPDINAVVIDAALRKAGLTGHSKIKESEYFKGLGQKLVTSKKAAQQY